MNNNIDYYIYVFRVVFFHILIVTLYMDNHLFSLSLFYITLQLCIGRSLAVGRFHVVNDGPIYVCLVVSIVR